MRKFAYISLSLILIAILTMSLISRHEDKEQARLVKEQSARQAALASAIIERVSGPVKPQARWEDTETYKRVYAEEMAKSD